MRLDRGIAQIQQFSMDRVDGIRGDASGWQHRASILFLDPQDDITPAKVVEVVCEGAYGVQDALRIPARFVLNAFAFDCALTSAFGRC